MSISKIGDFAESFKKKYKMINVGECHCGKPITFPECIPYGNTLELCTDCEYQQREKEYEQELQRVRNRSASLKEEKIKEMNNEGPKLDKGLIGHYVKKMWNQRGRDCPNDVLKEWVDVLVTISAKKLYKGFELWKFKDEDFPTIPKFMSSIGHHYSSKKDDTLTNAFYEGKM